MTISPHDDRVAPYAAEVFAGESVVVARLRMQVARIAPHFRIALLTGESGTGKGTVARRMHAESPVADEAFREVDVARFVEQPHGFGQGGTLYLRGLETLTPERQGRLTECMKWLERERRVIVGSRFERRGMVATGRLRQDLFEAEGTLEIRVPPLRERVDDIEVLMGGMLRRLRGAGISTGALDRMRGHVWPENLAELWRVCGRLAAGGVVELAAVGEGSASMRLDKVIERHVKDVLQGCGGNKLKAAEVLGISRSTLYRMLDAAG